MELLRKYPYPVFGGLVGLLLAISIICFGFFQTLFVLLCIILGAIVGHYIYKVSLPKGKGE